MKEIINMLNEKNNSYIKSMNVNGIELDSRYNVLREYDAMIKGVNALKGNTYGLTRIFCDSKCGSCYCLEFPEGLDPLYVWDVVFRFEKSLSGHNGVCVRGGYDIDFDPRWDEDDLTEEVEREKWGK